MRPRREAHPTFRVSSEEFGELPRKLEIAGERIECDNSLPGAHRFYTADPWGNRRQLLTSDDFTRRLSR